jgi:hypothetical protein
MEEIMAKKLDLKEMVTLEELILSNVYTQEALINLLVKKGLITNDEVIEEIKRLKIKHQKNYEK